MSKFDVPWRVLPGFGIGANLPVEERKVNQSAGGASVYKQPHSVVVVCPDAETAEYLCKIHNKKINDRVRKVEAPK